MSIGGAQRLVTKAIAVVLGMAFLAGCDGDRLSNETRAGESTPRETDSRDAGLDEAETMCPINGICGITIGIPFIRDVTTATDGTTTASLYSPDPGTICLTGTLAAALPDLPFNWGAALFFRVSTRKAESTQGFNAEELGITAFEFTIDSPPETGIGPFLGTSSVECDVRLSCPPDYYRLVWHSPLRLAVIDAGGTTKAAFADFEPAFENIRPLDTSRLESVVFAIPTMPGGELDYDFCLRDMRFRDAVGNAVAPPGTAQSR